MNIRVEDDRYMVGENPFTYRLYAAILFWAFLIVAVGFYLSSAFFTPPLSTGSMEYWAYILLMVFCPILSLYLVIQSFTLPTYYFDFDSGYLRIYASIGSRVLRDDLHPLSDLTSVDHEEGVHKGQYTSHKWIRVKLVFSNHSTVQIGKFEKKKEAFTLVTDLIQRLEVCVLD